MAETLSPLRADSNSIPSIISTLKSVLGIRLTKAILGTDSSYLKKWAEGQESPSEQQLRLIYATAYVADILRAYLTPKEMKIWLVSHSEYLYGIPALELRSRPEDVQNAALNRISRGEYYELLNERLKTE